MATLAERVGNRAVLTNPFLPTPISVEDYLVQQGEGSLLDFWRTQNETEAARQERAAPVWRKVGQIMVSDIGHKTKANLIGDVAKDPEALIHALGYFATTFSQIRSQDEWRDVLRVFGGKALPRVKRDFAEHLPLIARACEVDSTAFLDSRESPYSRFLSDLLNGNGSRELNLEEKCNALTVLCPSVFHREVVTRYCGKRPAIRQKLDEFRLNIQTQLQKDPPAFANLTARNISFYMAVAETLGWSPIETGEGLEVDLADVAIRRLNSYKDEAIANGWEKDLFGKYVQAMAISTFYTSGNIKDCLIGWGKPNSSALRAVIPPFLDDVFDTVINMAMSGDGEADSLIVSALALTEVSFKQQYSLPIVEEMIKTGIFSMDKIAYAVRKYVETKGAILDPDLISNEEIIRVLKEGDVELQIDPKVGVNLIYPDGTTKSVGYFVKKEERPVASGNGKQKAEAVVSTAAVVEAPTPKPKDPRAAAISQITELLQAHDALEKSVDKVLDELVVGWGEVYGSNEQRTKTLNPRGTAVKLFSGKLSRVNTRTFPRLELAVNYRKKSGTVDLSDLRGTIVLNEETALPFIISSEGILIDSEGGNFWSFFDDQDTESYFRLNLQVVSLVRDILITPQAVSDGNAMKIFLRTMDDLEAGKGEKHLARGVVTRVPTRLRNSGVVIRQHGEILSFDYGTDEIGENLELTEEELNSLFGEVPYVSVARYLAAGELAELEKSMARGKKGLTEDINVDPEREQARAGHLRYLGHNPDGTPKKPTRGNVKRMREREDSKHMRLRIRTLYWLDTAGNIRKSNFNTTYVPPVYKNDSP